jgi:hypothetical protein
VVRYPGYQAAPAAFRPFRALTGGARQRLPATRAGRLANLREVYSPFDPNHGVAHDAHIAQRRSDGEKCRSRRGSWPVFLSPAHREFGANGFWPWTNYFLCAAELLPAATRPRPIAKFLPFRDISFESPFVPPAAVIWGTPNSWARGVQGSGESARPADCAGGIDWRAPGEGRSTRYI